MYFTQSRPQGFKPQMITSPLMPLKSKDPEDELYDSEGTAGNIQSFNIHKAKNT